MMYFLSVSLTADRGKCDMDLVTVIHGSGQVSVINAFLVNEQINALVQDTLVQGWALRMIPCQALILAHLEIN